MCPARAQQLVTEPDLESSFVGLHAQVIHGRVRRRTRYGLVDGSCEAPVDAVGDVLDEDGVVHHRGHVSSWRIQLPLEKCRRVQALDHGRGYFGCALRAPGAGDLDRAIQARKAAELVRPDEGTQRQRTFVGGRVDGLEVAPFALHYFGDTVQRRGHVEHVDETNRGMLSLIHISEPTRLGMISYA